MSLENLNPDSKQEKSGLSSAKVVILSALIAATLFFSPDKTLAKGHADSEGELSKKIEQKKQEKISLGFYKDTEVRFFGDKKEERRFNLPTAVKGRRYKPTWFCYRLVNPNGMNCIYALRVKRNQSGSNIDVEFKGKVEVRVMPVDSNKEINPNDLAKNIKKEKSPHKTYVGKMDLTEQSGDPVILNDTTKPKEKGHKVPGVRITYGKDKNNLCVYINGKLDEAIKPKKKPKEVFAEVEFPGIKTLEEIVKEATKGISNLGRVWVGSDKNGKTRLLIEYKNKKVITTIDFTDGVIPIGTAGFKMTKPTINSNGVEMNPILVRENLLRNLCAQGIISPVKLAEKLGTDIGHVFLVDQESSVPYREEENIIRVGHNPRKTIGLRFNNSTIVFSPSIKEVKIINLKQKDGGTFVIVTTNKNNMDNPLIIWFPKPKES